MTQDMGERTQQMGDMTGTMSRQIPSTRVCDMTHLVWPKERERERGINRKRERERKSERSLDSSSRLEDKSNDTEE